jgi:hypothetical protein
MAQYPTNAFAKADIANGATSDASDVNDLAHEITAITDGLLNGTARLNSSNTTTNNFQAGGNSTLNAVTLRGALIPTGLVRVHQPAGLEPLRLHGGAESVSALRLDADRLASRRQREYEAADRGGRQRDAPAAAAVFGLCDGRAGDFLGVRRDGVDLRFGAVRCRRLSLHGVESVAVDGPGGVEWPLQLLRPDFLQHAVDGDESAAAQEQFVEATVQAVTGAGFGITVPVAALLQCDGGDILELSVVQTGSTQSVGNATLKNQFFINKVA